MSSGSPPTVAPQPILLAQQQAQQPAASSAANDTKRKAEPNGGTQTRAKRNRYISLACNECKRRKIKCNGQVPCQRCGHLSLECLYAPNCCNNNFKDSQEFRSMKAHIEHLQEQVNTLFANINDLYRKAELAPTNSSHLNREVIQSTQPREIDAQSLPSARQRSKHPRFHGPTSSVYNFDVAKSSLQTMGITPADDGTQDVFATHDATPAGSPSQQPVPSPEDLAHPAEDPLWLIKREEAIRLCRVYEEEIGMMYPLIDIEKLIERANLLFNFIEAADRTGLATRFKPSPDSSNDDDTNILKLVLAITLLLEGNGQSALGTRFFSSVKHRAETIMWDAVDVKTITILALVATYHFQNDNDILAYRISGLAARMCLEMGLHRRDALTKVFKTEEEIEAANRLFWSVYCLDRRWSLGTGLPFVIQDDDIDPCLPEPDGSFPYLKQMVHYCRLCSKVWYSGLGSEGTTAIKRDQIGYLDYQVVQWMKNMPEHMKFYSIDAPQNGEPVSRAIRRLRLLLYIRGNHLRILIYRPVLHSATSIMENMPYAERVVDIAKDTIRLLTRLNQTSDIYRSQQMLFNHFLVSALAVLFLAVSHAPVEFNRQVRDEFYMALDLIKGFSTKSYVSKRLWKMIKGLRNIGAKLGLFPRTALPESTDPHSTAAVAMAGLAGHPVNVFPTYRVNPIGELGNSPTNGLQITNELTNLFEAVGGYAGFFSHTSGSEGINGDFVSGDLHNNPNEGFYAVLGTEGEFSRIMRELF
ncbi:hypothetical protein VTO42DRAFT_6274 [Malbranchea cinnamomea]